MTQSTPNPLLATLRRSQAMLAFSSPEWERLLGVALQSALTPALAARAQDLDDAPQLPRAATRQFAAARVLADYNHRQIMWEANRLALALKELAGPVILLKGAAYHAGKLAFARARYASDVDILVPKSRIHAAEAALLAAGWQSVKQNPYDERYYRQWMHELPPFIHEERGTYLDVHHTILPESGRLTPDTERLFGHAVPLETGDPLIDEKMAILSPADMVLHAIVHWIQDGDLDRRLRDLLDIHEMLTEFGARPGFWDDLLAASRAHGFGRPLYYALVFSHELLGTAVPGDIWPEARQSAPPAPVDRTMRRLVPPAVIPDSLEGPARKAQFARFLLFIRSHWLRMPPLTLAMHLGRKTLMRFRRTT